MLAALQGAASIRRARGRYKERSVIPLDYEIFLCRRAFLKSAADFVTAPQKFERQRGQQYERRQYDGKTEQRTHVRDTEKTVAKTVDHVKERIEVRQGLPEHRQRVNRIKHTAQEGERHDDKILETGKLIELVGPQPGDDAERGERGAAEHGERQQHQRAVQRQRNEYERRKIHTGTNHHATHHRRQHERQKKLNVRQRRHQDKNQVAGDLRLNQAR